MNLDAVRTVAVVGAGTMGNGIAHVFARCGYRVILRDVERRFLDRALETISKNLDREIKKGMPVMVLVEVIRALQTSDTTFETTMKLCEKLEKKPVAVADSPGFVSNRVLMPLINEAAFCVMEGVAAPEAVDAVMKLGMNHPMGPLELADFIGLDVCLDVMEVLFEGFGDPKFRPCPLLKKMVAAGWLGKKSGRGFYTYLR
ncbi:MAG: hypothetical protein DMG32_04870 [Acidobacteria bacterium]|nr:MAG: hypothetical protein DMG32_04870 [Acidobacteriota bacterium]